VRSNKWPIIVMSAAAVLGVVAAVVLQLRPTTVDAKPAPTATVAQIAPPPSPAVIEPPAPPPVVATVAPAPTVPEVAPAPAPTIPETTAPATLDAEPVAVEPVAMPPVQAQRAKTVAPAKKKEPGFLRVNAYYWAYVRIDNGDTNEANNKFTLSPGRHVVKMWNDSNAQQTKVVTIESGKVKTIKVNLAEGYVEEQKD
jgi:hypothetical protein